MHRKRKPAKLKLSYRRLDAMINEYQENLRQGGCFVKTPKPLPVGRECRITVQAPGLAEPLQIVGVVTWSSADQEEPEQTGMSIEYRLDDRQRHALEQVLSALS